MTGGAGKAYVVGIGPGELELLTLKAARVVAGCSAVFHAGIGDKVGFAIEVVAPLLRPDQVVRGMALKMRRGADDGSVGYDRVVAAMAAESQAGRSVAFLTEGDPMLYGSGSYVVEHLRADHPEVPIEVIPGVSAISAAAARLGWPLAQKGEMLTICPATYHPDDIGAILDRGGSSCWLKAADVLPRLIEELRRRGRLDRSALVERIGRLDERIFVDASRALGEDLSYFSMVLVR